MLRYREFDLICSVLEAEQPEEPLTAREIAALLETVDADTELDNPHRIATVLGHHAEAGDVDVIRSSPYKYRIRTAE